MTDERDEVSRLNVEEAVELVDSSPRDGNGRSPPSRMNRSFRSGPGIEQKDRHAIRHRHSQRDLRAARHQCIAGVVSAGCKDVCDMGGMHLRREGHAGLGESHGPEEPSTILGDVIRIIPDTVAQVESEAPSADAPHPRAHARMELRILCAHRRTLDPNFLNTAHATKGSRISNEVP
jgi:hypothetical protein